MRLVPTLCLLAVSLPAWTAELPPVADGPAAPVVETVSITPERLLDSLPKSATVTLVDGRLWWDDGQGTKIAIALVDCGQGNPLIETEIGRMAVDRKLMSDERAEVIARIPPLIAMAKAAGLSGEGLVVREGILTGIHLRADATLVLAEGVLTKDDFKPASRGRERENVESLTTEVIGLLGATSLDDLGRKTVEDVLKRLPNEDGKQQLDEVSPSLARRLVRNGWLDQFLTGQEPARQLTAAISASDVFVPITRFAGTTADGKPLLLAEVKDAFDQGGWILRTPTRSALTRLMPMPLYHWGVQAMNLVVELPPEADPTTYPDAGVAPLSARLYRNGKQVAAWSKDSGFTADKALWREAVPDDRRKQGVDHNAATDFMPPHILVAGFNGDLGGLITAGGWLAAPTADTKDAERFLREAATQLPDAAHLDLIGQYILSYVYDSPDSRYPQLIGNKQVKGDIHQTAQQTLATATGGVIRGDCDDLAELYQVIAERQGRTSIVLALPSHAANAWAEKQADGKWHVFVLQTGPALEFTDASLPKALEAAYKSFGASEIFDPNGLGLLLRFSGENTRSSWRLSWRIFAEPDYAKAMIDVQKDWHFQTYQRGINTMLEMIAKGDKDTANFRELSGLYNFTGQYDEAATYHQLAIDAMDPAKDSEALFAMRTELLGHLFEAKQDAKAKALAKDLIEVQFPAVKSALGASAWSAGLELVGVLKAHDAADLAAEAYEAMLLDNLSDQLGSLQDKVESLAGYVQSPKFNQATWENSSQMLELRSLTSQHAGMSIALLNHTGSGALAQSESLQSAAKTAELWLTHLAFHDIDEPGEAAARYASAGRYYAAILGQGRFDQLLAAAALPAQSDVDHTRRVGGLAQVPLDLPWIRLSVIYWLGRMQELVAKDKPTLDRAEIARLAMQLDEAYVIGTKLGLEHPQIEFGNHLGKLIAALIAQDAKAVAERLQYVYDKNDKRLRDDTAQCIGDLSRFMSPDWFGRVMAMWDQQPERNKQKYFWIAWRAVLTGGTQQGLLAAKVAADRFRDDPAFAEEYQFMRKLYEPPAPK